MKILFLSHKFYPDIGGIESVSEILADAFMEQGHQVRILTWSVQKGDKDFPYSIIRKPNLPRTIREILWADIVFENNPCLRLSWPNLFLQKPLVVALHTWIGKSVNEQLRIPQKMKFIWLKRADKVIACSEAIRKETFPAAITIGNPYNNILFKKKPAILQQKDYVFLGRLVSDKGVDLAIKAFNEVLQKGPQSIVLQSTFTIIGDGDEKQALEQLSVQLGIADKIVFSGSMKGEALVEELNQHRYMLIPSLWHEPFGIVALEGMACGCLPIVSNSGGLPDAVGKAGVTFERGNKDSLAASMIKLKTEVGYQSDIIAAAPAHLKKHESKSVAAQYLQVLKSVVDKRKGR